MLTQLGPLCAFTSSLTWAAGTAAYASLAREHSPFTVNLSRAIVALPLFLALSFWLAGGLPEWIAQFRSLAPRELGWIAIAMFASYGLGDSIFMWSANRIGLPAALAIASSSPIWTTLAGAFYRGDRLSWVQGLGLLISVGGIVTVILSGPKAATPEAKAPHGRRTGIWLGFLTSLFWALNIFAISHVGRSVPQGIGNSVRMVFALLLTLVIGRAFDRRAPLLLPVASFRRYLWAFVLEGFGGSYFFFYGLAHSPLALGSVLSSLAPVVSVPVAIVLRLERFSVARTFGVLMVVIGIVLLFI